MRKKIVVLHETNYWNMGDFGLTIALLQSLNRRFDNPDISILSMLTAHEKPDAQHISVERYGAREIPFFSYKGRDQRNTFIEKVMFLLTLLRTTLGILFYKFNPQLGCMITQKEMRDGVQELCNADIIISKPGGFLNGSSLIPAPHWLAQIWFATLTKKPVMIYGQSIGPFRHPWAKFVVRYILNRTDVITVRDEPSLFTCEQLLKLNKPYIELTADEGFLLKGDCQDTSGKDNSELATKAQPVIGMTVVNWNFPNFSEDGAAIRKNTYIQAMAQLCNHLVDCYQAKLVLFTHVLPQNFTRDDVEVTKRVYEGIELKSHVILFETADPRTIQAEQAQLDAFVGSRMHSNIFALTSHVPVLAISYLPKTRGIMNMIAMSNYVIDIDKVNPNDILERFDTFWSQRSNIRRSLDDEIPKIKDRARRNSQLANELALS